MHKVKYVGQPCNIGRFGRVETGAELRLYEQEFLTVQNNSDFEDLGTLHPLPTHNGVQTLPWGTALFDLRTIKWNSDRLHRHLNKLSDSRVRRLANAMNLLGLPVANAPVCSKEEILDSVMHFAALEKWTELSREEIHGCGLFNARVFAHRVSKAAA